MSDTGELDKRIRDVDGVLSIFSSYGNYDRMEPYVNKMLDRRSALERIRNSGTQAELSFEPAPQREDLPTISDGFGSEWPAICAECGRPTMAVVRPGKAQCSECGA